MFKFKLEILSSSQHIDGWDYQTVSVPQVSLFANNKMYENQWNHVMNVEYIQTFLADMKTYQNLTFSAAI